MLVYTCEQMRVIEENAFVGGYPYYQMMVNAGKNCADKIHSLLSEMNRTANSVTVICGAGKNGGDGFVIAGVLSDYGYSVRIVLVNGYPSAHESKIAYSSLEDKPIIVSDLENNYDTCVSACMSSAAIVDCVFGIGFHGTLKDPLSKFFNDIAKSRAKKFAIDIPSGLEGNSGKINGAYFKTDYTLAITCYKPVHIAKPAAEACGVKYLIDIGIDKSCYEAVSSSIVVSADFSEIKKFFKPRNPDSNKGTYGRLLSIAGSYTMQGAAVMAANAAINSGVGIVECVFPDMAYPAIAAKVTEALMSPMKSTADGFLSGYNLNDIIKKIDKSTAVLLGCGLGCNSDTMKIVDGVLRNTDKTVILDADGINAVSMNINLLKETKASVIITPHPGEMARLTGMSIEEIQKDRIKAAKDFAVEYGCMVVLKGSNTVVAGPSGSVYINQTGNAGMATGGSGDVLAGIIASFVCQGMGIHASTIAGVFIHGYCGDTVKDKYSMHGVTPTRMIDELAGILSIFE